MPKGKSPFRFLQGEGDTLKKEALAYGQGVEGRECLQAGYLLFYGTSGVGRWIDAFMEECGLVLDDSSLKDRTSRMKKLFERCGALRKKCKALEKKLTNLSKGKEPTVIPNFDEMRSEEVDRMHVLEVRLKKIGNKLEPDEVEESYFNNVKDNDESMKEQGSKPPTGEFDDDSNDDDDDDDDEEDDEMDDDEKEESKMETTNPDEENEGDVDNEDGGKKTKFKRRSMFRRSKTDIKVEKVEDDAEKEKKDKKDKDKKDKKDKDKKGKEKSEKEKEKEKEKERKEQEKKEKKEKEKLEKERKEKEKKEQKEKEQEEKKKKKEEKELAAKLAKSKKGEDGDTKKDKDEDKRPDSPSKRGFGAKSKKGEDGDTKKDKDEDKRPDSPSKRGFGAKLFSRDSKKPKIEESKKDQSGTIEDESEDEEDAEDGIDNEEGEGAEEDMEEEDGEREEEDEEEDDEEEELEDLEEEEEEEEEQQEEKQKKVESKQDKKKGWSFLRRDKSPQRQVKKDNNKDDKKKKKEDKKQVRVQEEEEEEEDEEEEEEDVDEEEEYEDEEEEDDEEEEEESDDEQVVMKGKKPQRVESEEEEEGSEEEEEEEEEGEEEELEDEEESEEELLEGESDEEEEEENFKPPDEGMDLFEAVCDFEGEEDDDLYFKRGAILTILNVREDGWWMAEDEEGNKGLVPSTYLKLKKEHNDYRDVQSPEVDEAAESVSPRSGKELWRGLRKSVTETGVTDVLTAMGAIPAGFRPSTTAKHLRLDAYTLCNFLKPRFTESCLGFQDLNWSPHENQIRAKTVRLQKILTLLMVRNMPPCGVGIEIRSRHVRICFFDGDKILSNIHTIQATWNKNDPKTWRFSPKVTSLLPSILDGDCFIRSSRTDENTGLLFELCLSYVRPKTGEKGELSCGWVNVPLYDTATGAPIVNKMYEFQVQGGTPFEQEVEVDPSISRRTSSSKFRSMMSANKQPRIQIKFITPTKEQKPLLDTLPETIVSSLGYLPFLSIFRNLQAVEVLRDRIDLQNADLIHCPVLANFPEATKYPDIMDALRSCWADKKLKNKKIDKKDPEQMKELFTSTFMDSVYPIMRLPSLPPYKWAEEERDSERWQVISEFLQSNKQKGILASFLAPGGEHSPFDMTEVAFNLLDSFQELK